MKLRWLRLPLSWPEMLEHPSYIEAASNYGSTTKILVLQIQETEGGDWKDLPVVDYRTERLDLAVAGL